MNNRISGNGNFSIRQNGSGTTTLGGTGDNSAAQATVVNAGTLVLNKTSSSTLHALGGTTDTVNSGGTLQLDGNNGGDQIFDGTAVTINSGGQFDLNGQSEVVTNVSLSGTGISNTGAITNSSSSLATLNLGNGTREALPARSPATPASAKMAPSPSPAPARLPRVPSSI